MPELNPSRRAVLGAALGATVLAALPAVPAEAHTPDDRAPDRREHAEFIFFPSAVFSDPAVKERYFDYLTKFQVCLTNGYDAFSGQDLERLHRAGCELFIYRWFNGYYDAELSDALHDAYPDVVDGYREINRHPDWLINPGAPVQGGGAVTPAYFYDWGNAEFRAFFSSFVLHTLALIDYDGVFFDYIGDWALPPQIATAWTERHPDISYNDAGAEFVKELRQSMRHGQRIFGNGTYRLANARTWYRYIDYDVTESYGTSFIFGKQASIYLEGQGITPVYETFFRLWDGEAGYKSYIGDALAQVTGAPVHFFEINYLQARYAPTGDTAVVDGQAVPVFRPETDRAAIYYGYALSRMNLIDEFNSDWYAAAPGQGDLYFTDLGRPLEPTYREQPESVVRYFQNGFVLVTRGTGPLTFAPDSRMVPHHTNGLWDSYAQQAVPGWRRDRSVTVTPQTYPATGSSNPSGRVYLYT